MSKKSPPLEILASTISEVLSITPHALFTTGLAQPNFEFTVKLQCDLNTVLRNVCFPIKVPFTGKEGDPVFLPATDPAGQAQARYELAQSEFQTNFKSTWHTQPARLSDQHTTPDNDNSQTASFNSTMTLLLAILFKEAVITLPEQAGHDDLKVEHLLPVGTSVLPHAVDHWLSRSNAVTSFNHETFVAQQFEEILDSAQFQNRYKAYAHDPNSVALEPTPEMFHRSISGAVSSGAVSTNESVPYYVCRHYVYLDPFHNYHHRKVPAPAVVATSEAFPRVCVRVQAGLLGWDAVHVANRTAAQLRILTSLTGVSFHLDSGQTLYRIPCFRIPDINGFDVYVSKEYVSDNALTHAHPALFGPNTTVTTAGLKWCKKPSHVMGYLPDAKGVLLQQQWSNSEPTQGTSCRYEENTATLPTSYCVCTVPVYQVIGGAYYLGQVQAGWDVTESGSVTFCLGQLVSDVLGCTNPTFPVGGAAIWQAAGSSPITTWTNPNTHTCYGQSDVYKFNHLAEQRTFARESRAEVQYVAEGANYLGFRQGTWRRPFLPIAALGQALPEANVLGGQLHLQPGDAIGIVVDLASDAAGFNKTLHLRLLIEQC